MLLPAVTAPVVTMFTAATATPDAVPRFCTNAIAARAVAGRMAASKTTTVVARTAAAVQRHRRLLRTRAIIAFTVQFPSRTLGAPLAPRPATCTRSGLLSGRFPPTPDG